VVSFSRGKVYKVNLATAKAYHLFTYPNHYGDTFCRMDGGKD
jgi:hypothetical protein